jgi:O-antigen/teichoic acid export membrane protein
VSTIKKALAYSVIGGYLTSAISLAIVIVTVRLLTPEELGLFAIAASILIIADNLKSFGIAQYLVRLNVLTTLDIRRALTLSMIISWSLGIIVICLAYPISLFYELADIYYLLLIMSVSFFFTPYVAISGAIFQREFKYGIFVIIDLANGIVQFVVLIILIALDFSYFAIAYSILFGNVVQLILHIVFQSQNLFLRPAFENIREIGTFGFYLTFIHLFTRLNLILPDLIIGKLGSPRMVALFSRGIGLIDFAQTTVTKGISGVSLPYLSKVNREGGDLAHSYTRACELVNSILLPCMALVFLLSEQVILLFFGDKWIESAPLVEIFAIWAAVKSFHIFANSIFITGGKEKVPFFIEAILTLILGISIFIVFPYGLEAVAYIFVVISVIRLLVVSVFVQVLFKVKPSIFFAKHLKSVACALSCLVTANYLVPYLSDIITGNFLFLCSVCSMSLSVWLITAIMLRLQIIQEFSSVIRPKKLKQS